MPFNINRKVIILAAAVVVVLVIAFVPMLEKEYTEIEAQTVMETYYESEPYTEVITEIVVVEHTFNLFNAPEFALALGGRKVYTAEIDISDKTANIITGYVKMLEYAPYNFYVVSEAYYLKHAVYSHSIPEEYYVGIDNAEYETFSFVPDYSGKYYFVFTAYEPVPTYYKDLNQFDADWQWLQEMEQQTEVTSYRDVAKQREVTSDVAVTETKRVSLLMYLLD